MARAVGNWRLVAGGVLCLALLVVAVFGPYLAPYPEGYSEKLLYCDTPQGPVAVYAPVPPSRLHPLGTDRWGYDILSLLMYGGRFTVFTALGVAPLRMLARARIGLYLGLCALMYVSRTHEWAGMIGQARTSLQADRWMLPGPLLAYLLAVVGFYALLRGMEHRHRADYHNYPKI